MLSPRAAANKEWFWIWICGAPGRVPGPLAARQRNEMPDAAITAA